VIAAEVGMSAANVFHIPVSAEWIPCMLNGYQHATCLLLSIAHLQCWKKGGRIVFISTSQDILITINIIIYYNMTSLVV
jgi:hypothetical protein